MTQAPSRRSRWLVGCSSVALLTLLTPLAIYGGWAWWAERQHEVALAEQAAKAEEVFAPAQEQLEVAVEAETYDIDATIRIIHGIDLALAQETSLEGYLRTLSRQDYEGVAPEVLEARGEILDILKDLYALQTEAEDQAALWEVTSELLLATLSVVEMEGSIDPLAPSGKVGIDRKQAKRILDDLKDRQARHDQLVRDISGLEGRLFDALVDYSDVYWTYVREWDTLSLARDRAYLAATEADWDAAIVAADQAIAMAPGEREAHLLKAWSLIEQGNAETIAEVDAILADLLTQHPDHSAPTLLLQGANLTRAGDTAGARLALRQAAAYYPEQSDHLLDMLDPYKMRSFLRKSREGGYILELYQGTMTGAGYFSPDLQLARLAFETGDFEGGKAKVLDHFARRRAQEQWDFILSDVAFCHDLLGPQFWEILPENTWMDLEVSPTLLGGELNLSIENRSERVLHNATLVLALHLTDMYPDDYVAIRVPETAPAIVGLDTTSFGSLPIELELNGQPKGVGDIVHHRAIVISDEAVTWVDTDAFKIAEADEFRKLRDMGQVLDKQVDHPSVKRHPEFRDTVDRLTAAAAEQVSFSVDEGMIRDDVLVELPRELSLLRPVFRLRYGDELYAADDNLIEGDRIRLRFMGVDDIPRGQRADDMELLVGSPFGDVVMTWHADGTVQWTVSH